MLRKALGTVLAGSKEHFVAARIYDLSPFRELKTALIPHGSRLLEVALHQITTRTPAESEIDVSRARKDVRDDAALASVLDEATRVGIPVAVKLYLKILDRRRPLKVELSAKAGRNRLSFDRSIRRSSRSSKCTSSRAACSASSGRARARCRRPDDSPPGGPRAARGPRRRGNPRLRARPCAGDGRPRSAVGPPRAGNRARRAAGRDRTVRRARMRAGGSGASPRRGQ